MPLSLSNYQTKVEDSDFLKNMLGANLHPNLMEIPIVIFGAGKNTQELLYHLTELYRVPIRAIVDNFAEDGTEIDGMAVSRPEEADLDQNSSVIVLVKNNRTEIVNQLIKLGVKRNRIHLPEIRHLEFYSHIKQWYLDDGFLEGQSHNIETALSVLSDDVSKSLLMHRLGLFSKGADYKSYQWFLNKFSMTPEDKSVLDNTGPETFLYFNNSLINNVNNVLVDVGVCRGEAIKHFTKKNNGDFSRIYAIEPDPDCFEKLESSYRSDKRIKIFNFAAWNCNERLEFFSYGNSKSHVASRLENSNLVASKGETCNNQSTIFVDGKPIDELNISGQTGIIKIDVEGAEKQTIEGMVKTLASNDFELIISAYHRAFDVVELLLQIHGVANHYNFYLRLFSDSLTELVILAVQSKLD